MFKPFTLFIAFRYIRAKKGNHFISFISMSSMLGIALGVMVLITVLSVMNGFDQQIKNRVFSMAPQLTVSSLEGYITHWQSNAKEIKNSPLVEHIAPYVTGQGMLTSFGQTRPTLIYGVLPQYETQISDINKLMVSGQMSALKAGDYRIVLGQTLATNLGLTLGDKVTLIIPQASTTPLGVIPRFKRFTVVGIFDPGSGFGFDSGLAYINLHDAQTLFQLPKNQITGLRIKLTDLYQAPKLSQELKNKLSPDKVISNWTETYGQFFQAIQLEKTMMFLVLLLIIAIGAFNLVASLVMVTHDKLSDIAILRTLGATPRNIVMIFIYQGTLIGCIGTLLGLLSGIILSLHATEIVQWIQQIFHLNLFASGVYYVDYLPSQLELMDVLKVCSLALLFSFLSTIYPAYRAAKILPAEALRYE